MADDAKKQRIHQKLLIEISENLDQTQGSQEFEHFDTALANHLPDGIRARNSTIITKLKALETRGLLGPGNYRILKEIADDANNVKIKQLIENAERKMEQTSHGATGTTQPIKTEAERNPEPSTGLGNKQPIQVIQKDNEGGDSADPLFRQKYGKSYYDTAGKKGFLLILNSENNRAGTEEDVTRLKDFFGKTLGFEIDDPRSFRQSDLTLEEFEKCLANTRERLNDAHSAKYYCFICVIMSHGNESGVETADGMYDTSKIRKFFDNSQMPKFAGKPKIFFIQACRGSQDQGYVDQADDKRDEEGMDVDEADKIHEIPIDADSLLAYATTPGYTAFAETNVIRGTYFLLDVYEVFKENYSRDHVEEMLISVREKTAVRNIEIYGTKVKQMPDTWSTLTKRLLFTPWRPPSSNTTTTTSVAATYEGQHL